jgi:hypothetical protein
MVNCNLQEENMKTDLQADARTVSKPINKGIAKVFKKYPVRGK